MRFSRPLHRLALATGLSTWMARFRPARRILMLHGVGDRHMPAAEFERAVTWLTRRFRIVSLSQMVDELIAGTPVPAGGELALTFDDGLHNQLEFAYPVLERLGVPATYFVCPTLIDQHRWLWTQETRSRLETLGAPARAEFASACGCPVTGVEPIVTHMKTLRIDERMRQEAALRELTPAFQPTEAARRMFDPLGWDEIARLDPALVTIGSHTLTHPILTSIDDAALEHEIIESRRVLEERLRRTVDLFCYPNGSMDQRVRDVVARTYRAAVTTESGFVEPAPRLHRLHRIPATPNLALLAWRMHRPVA